MMTRVLIVDDQAGFSHLLRSALEMIERNLAVSEALTGEEALKEIKTSQIDLLIADYRLPGINGLELMKEFRLINPDSRVIMISGVADQEILKQIEEASPDAFFPKPVPMSDFLEAVEECLKNKINPGKVDDQSEYPEIDELLGKLRKKLNVQSVCLLNDLGKVIAETGRIVCLQDNRALQSALISMIDSSRQVAGLLENTDHQVHLINGNKLDGVFLPVGSDHGLFLLGKGLTGARALSSRLELINNTRLELMTILSKTLN